MGVLVERIDESTYSFEARDIDFNYLQSEDYRQRAARLRGSVMIIGPLLARFGVGYIPKPEAIRSAGVGSTPISSVFRSWAPSSTFDTGTNFFSVEGRRLKGCYMLLDKASVTARPTS